MPDKSDMDDDESSSMSQNIVGNLKLSGVIGSNQDLVNIEQKNLKIKESAKNSRLRKKIYLQMLENKVHIQ